MHVYTTRLAHKLSRSAFLFPVVLALAVFIANRAAAQAPAPPPNALDVLPPENANSPSTPYLTAEEELKTFDLKPGYKMELVVGDPNIKEPVVAVFDGNGRMYVAEMRTY